MKIKNLRVNHLENPLGYEMDSNIHLSWEIEDEVSIDHIIVVVSEDEDFRRIILSETVQKNYVDINIGLEHEKRYFWKVHVYSAGKIIQATSWFETGLNLNEFTGKWISTQEETKIMPCLYKDFQILKPIKRARVYCTGFGLFELYINEEKQGDEFLLPGYHSYDLRQQIISFDVTDSLIAGNNKISTILGEGWYKGRFVFDGGFSNIYGNKKKFIATIKIEYQDGTKDIITTDKSWKAIDTHIQNNGIYDGEIKDFKADKKLRNVIELEDKIDLLTNRTSVAVKKVKAYEVKELIITPKDEIVLDFGRMITGWVEFESNKEDELVSLQYSEVLQEDCFYRDNLRTAKAEFVCKLDKTERIIRPHFTYYGFRYVKIEGFSNIDINRFKAYRIMSDLKDNGFFSTQNEEINKLVDNSKRSQKCNFIDIPLDCPQRDERMGWTGDVTIFAKTACYNMHSAAFFDNYLVNLRKEQEIIHGSVPFFVPKPKIEYFEGINPFLISDGVCTWGDVATVLPYELYLHYRDKAMLKRHYSIMKDWVKYIERRASNNGNPNLWLSDRHLGDWLALDNGDINNPIGSTDSDLIASAYYYNSVNICYKAAKILEYSEDEEYYLEKSSIIKEAFKERFLSKEGNLLSEETQTAYSIILYFKLYEDSQLVVLKKGLYKQLKKYNFHISTGFVGTGMLLQALSESGMHKFACDLVLNEDYPSWLYAVKLGATTIWERWNSLLSTGDISGTDMNSLNHYAYGCVVGWFYEYVCGISFDESNYIKIKPRIDKRFGDVKASYNTVYGEVKIEILLQENKCNIEVYIPYGATANIVLEDGTDVILTSGKYKFKTMI